MFTNLQENVIKDLATVYQISTPQLLLIVSALGIIIYLIKIKMEEGVYKRINQVLEEYKKDIKKKLLTMVIAGKNSRNTIAKYMG